MGDLSKHFDQREFRCHDGCGYGQPHPRLINGLEQLRQIIGDKPIAIVSGVRCPPHNTAVDGGSRSRHQSGEAADLRPGLVRRSEAVSAGFTGIGTKGAWVTHVDVRRATEPVFWTYPE